MLWPVPRVLLVAEGSQELPNVVDEESGFFEGGEVAAAVVDVGPADDGVGGGGAGPDADVVEKPKPGSEGLTRWTASPGSPPCAAGSVRGPMRCGNSRNDPGHPWVTSSGTAPGSAEGTWAKWITWPSMTVMNCGTSFSRPWKEEKSNSCQASAISRR
jgi:hypothetical protein